MLTRLLGWSAAERSTCLTVERCLLRCGIAVTCQQVIQSRHGSSRGSKQRQNKERAGFLSL